MEEEKEMDGQTKRKARKRRGKEGGRDREKEENKQGGEIGGSREKRRDMEEEEKKLKPRPYSSMLLLHGHML